jgi:hypothetical protein
VPLNVLQLSNTFFLKNIKIIFKKNGTNPLYLLAYVKLMLLCFLAIHVFFQICLCRWFLENFEKNMNMYRYI